MNELNATFNNFVNFAREAIAHNNADAVARVGTEGAFKLGSGRTVTVSQKGDADFDKTFAFFRSDAAKSANEAARTAFKQAIVDIFGGERSIPDSVKAQMTNFDTTKPLSARRIMNIANAIADFAHTESLLDAGNAMTSFITGVMDKVRTAPSVAEAATNFIAQAQEKADNAINAIKVAQADIKRGAISDLEFCTKLSNAKYTIIGAFGGSEMGKIFRADKQFHSAMKAINQNFFKTFDDLYNPMYDSVLTRHATQLHKEIMKLPGSESLPNDIYYSIYNAKRENLGAIDKFIQQFKKNPEQFKPTADQMARIRKLTPNANAAERLALALSHQKVYEILDNKNGNSIEDKLQKFEANGAELARVLKIAVREDLSKEQICSEIGKLIEANFNACAALDPSKNMRAFDKNGLCVQSMRETNGGLLTYNGAKIEGTPSPQAEEKFSHLNAFGQNSVKHAETLTTIFDENHMGMRKMVSLLSSMADGLGGIIEEVFYGEKDNNLVDRKNNRTALQNKTDSNFASQNRDKDKAEFTIAENGDVTFKLTKYLGNQVLRLGGLECGKRPGIGTKLDRGTLIAETKFEVTVRIPSQNDAELNGAMPKLEVVDFAQEIL